MTFEDLLVRQARKHQRLGGFLKRVARNAFPENVILLEYPIHSKPRWHHEAPNRFLYRIIDDHRPVYEAHLRSFLAFVDDFARIPERPPNGNSIQPAWLNGWLPAMDSVALFSFLALNNPKYYLEVGSGNSTKFARQAIANHGLRTQIISIDPHPRAEVDEICDRVIRQPVEQVGLEVFDLLSADDILFIDSSHRALMNSDATTLFLDVIPRLKRGVLVQIHDVTLPYDYPAEWVDRYYSEQYLLGASLLAEGNKFAIVLPGTFISDDPKLKTFLSPLWSLESMKNVERWGCSFWIETK